MGHNWIMLRAGVLIMYDNWCNGYFTFQGPVFRANCIFGS